ncbi:DUF1802 family protein [Anabaena sp. CCY 9402-a]|uniref:DUF1802 family protein n=1 Tax=Anabaena sp. CCY 9402-a TaxID=3103867 RepID=UPI0039C6BAEB
MINIALCLPAPEIEVLLQGRIIAVIANKFITPGREFALCSSDASINLLPVEQCYRSSFLLIAQSAFSQLNSQGVLIQPQQMSLLPNEEQLKLPLLAYETVLVKAWARCELCQIINRPESLTALSQLTIWKTEFLQEILKQKQNIFLTYLRVYQLSKSIELSIKSNSQFVTLPQTINILESSPVLNDRTFAQRRQQLEKLEPPKHPELEELQIILSQFAITNSAAKELDSEIKKILGWSSDSSEITLDSDFVWINKIAEIGNSSDGQTFEKLVRRGLIKLGFTGSHLNPDATGGAGGMDFYTEAPFPIVGECKATKTEKVSDGTPAQLLKIGVNHLGKFQYEQAIKLIVAAGELNDYALRTATEHYMNVIRPETLQKLVELQAQHKNSINLLELKEHLQKAPFGLADDKINTYIDKVEQNIQLRSHIIQLVKNYLQNSGVESTGVDALHGAYFGSKPPQPIKPGEMHEILIELSSPLTGYLGRIKGSDWRSDRFYYLRDLPIN